MKNKNILFHLSFLMMIVLFLSCTKAQAEQKLPIGGKGMIKELRNRYPDANISAIDYDPGSSEVNQLNRLKLLLANAPVGRHPDEKKV